MASAINNERFPMGSFVKRIAIVQSRVPRPETILRISNLDRQCPTLMYLLFFYERNHLPTSLLFDNLRSSLEETLSVWYPAAGRHTSVSGEIAGPKPKLDLICNNDGAILVESAATVKISKLGDLSGYNEFFAKLVYRPTCRGSLSQMPLLVAQVTHFGCGGYSIGIGASLSLFDGPAALDFLRSWSANSVMTKGNCELRNRNPVFERGRLLISSTDDHISLPLGKTTKANVIEHMHQLIKQAAAANGRSKHGSARTGALGIKKGTMVCLQFAFNARTRMVPPLSKSFAGNAYVLASIVMTAGQLEEASYEDVARKIRDAKKSVTNDYVEAYMEALERSEAIVLHPLDKLTIVSDWTRIPFHEVEFLGQRANYMSPMVAPVPYVAYLMRNLEDNGAIDIRIGLRPDTECDFI